LRQNQGIESKLNVPTMAPVEVPPEVLASATDPGSAGATELADAASLAKDEAACCAVARLSLRLGLVAIADESDAADALASDALDARAAAD
jgi:hypothetical protein